MDVWSLWSSGLFLQGFLAVKERVRPLRTYCNICNILFFFVLNQQFPVNDCKDRTMFYVFAKEKNFNLVKKRNSWNPFKISFHTFPTMNHLIKKRSITTPLLVYLICPLAHDSASPCSFNIQQGLQVSLHKNLQQIYLSSEYHKKEIFEERRMMKESRVTTELGYPGASKAEPLCLCKRAGSCTF